MDALANAFAGLGLNPEDVIAVSLLDGVDFFLLFLGLSSTAVCAPLNPAFSTAETKTQLTILGARAVIVESPDSTAATVARTLGITVLISTNLLQSVPARSDMLRTQSPDRVAVLLHTSATTGGAKLVPLTHSNLQAMAGNTRRILDLTDSDRFLSMMPLFHLQGLLSSLAQLLAGGGVMFTVGFDASSFWNWLREFRPTWYTAGPALHSAILDAAGNQPDPASQTALRFVRSIGAPLPRDLSAALESALQVPLLDGYGMTEAGMVTSNAPVSAGRKSGSVGRSGGVEVGIMNDAGDLLPAGRVGQIAVRGPAVVNGYFNDPEATRNAFRNGWFLSGDLGRLDEEGFLFVTGRIKEIVNRGGEKIIPTEVDAVLASHPAVAEAAAFGVAHPTLGEDVAAAVVLRPGESVSESDLRRFAAGQLAPFKVPRRIFFLDAIPKGPTGKPKRESLSADMKDRMASPEPPGEALVSPVAKKIAEIWKRILGCEPSAMEDDFFALGGDSFAATLMLAEMEAEFGLNKSQLEDTEFIVTPDIATLTRLVDEALCEMPHRSPSPKSPVVALQPHGSRIPFFCFPGSDENPYYFRLLAQNLGADQPFFILRDPRPLEERGAYTVEEAAGRFTELICSLHRDRRFILGGHCFGGIVAFEVARQLVARGHNVALVALFEVPAPGFPKVVRHWKEYVRQGWLMLRKRQLAMIHQASSHFTVLVGLLKKRIMVLRRRFLMRTGLKLLVEPLEKSDHPNTQAGRSYQPKSLTCDIVQFIAANEPHSTLILDDPRLAWQEFTQGDFTVRRTPGLATAIFKQPHVTELAAQLRTVLDAIHIAANRRG